MPLSHAKRLYVGGATALIVGIAVTLLVYRSSARQEQLHFEREETELIVSNTSGAAVSLFKAGNSLPSAASMPPTSAEQVWLPRGNYFLKVDGSGTTLFYPVPITGYRSGPDEDGAFTITIRSLPDISPPPRLLSNLPEFAYIPSGHFLIGDRLNKQEPHYVWLTGFFISPFEVTNAEFRQFLNDPSGYGDDSNWTEAGARWKAGNASRASALLNPEDSDFKRFGQPDQPVTHVNWFEAAAFCRWLTQKIGDGKWMYTLPTDAEWEKAARGPDSFDYGLGMLVSDAEVHLYNWKKNPGAEVTVVGFEETQSNYSSNRYGLYHMTGNVAEWTQSVFRAHNRGSPYVEDERNHDETPGQRTVRGGSWYTASIAVLYIPYRENFQPEVSAPYLGFRVAARLLP
jgi:formylglycine-generating enzyme required for sulfatase activity